MKDVQLLYGVTGPCQQVILAEEEGGETVPGIANPIRGLVLLHKVEDSAARAQPHAFFARPSATCVHQGNWVAAAFALGPGVVVHTHWGPWVVVTLVLGPG